MKRFLMYSAIGVLSIAALFGLHEGVVLFVDAHGWVRLNPADWAAWVGAMGTVGALGVAIWISKKQHDTQRLSDQKKERDALKAMLKILRVEIEVLSELSNSAVGKTLASSTPGTPFLLVYPLQEKPFTIFDAIAPQLGTVHDDELRRKIVKAYAIAKGYVGTFRHHNEIVNEYIRLGYAAENSGSAVDRQRVDGVRSKLTQYSDALRTQHAMLQQQIKIMLEALPS